MAVYYNGVEYNVRFGKKIKAIIVGSAISNEIPLNRAILISSDDYMFITDDEHFITVRKG